MFVTLVIFFFFLPCWVFVAARLSLVAVSRGCSLVAVRGLLTAGPSLVVVGARTLGHAGFRSCGCIAIKITITNL